jgi:hypothetical protein
MAEREDGTRPLTPRIVLGLGVMAFGLMLTLGQLGLVSTRQWLRCWPALLILFGLACLVESPTAWRRPRGYVWILVGTGLLLDNLGLLDVSRFFFPALLILVGGAILRGGRGRCRTDLDAGQRLGGLALMGGVSRKATTDDFRGGDFAAFMGGVEVDLREARIREDQGPAEIEAFAFWGGIEIWVPRDWQVVSKGVAVLGGFEDTSRAEPGASQRLVVRGMAIMGGVEIKNKDAA